MNKINIHLQNGNSTIKKISKEDNDIFLCQDDTTEYPLLSELSLFSPDVFGYEDAKDLIKELEKLATTLKDEDSINHINEIISLVQECIYNNKLIVMFNPFV